MHLDASFAALGVNARVGGRLREAQRRVFSKIVARARDWPADMVLIAGDLFDGAEAHEETVAFVLESFERLAPIPIFIAPGNRDPYTDDSPYARELWPDNVTIFAPGAWRACRHPSQPLVVHGIGCDGEDDTGAWFDGLRAPDDGNMHVALAHGTERSCRPQQGKCFAPFDAAAVAQDGLAYLALGHFHEMAHVEGDFSSVLRYPGSPQGRSHQEQGKRYFLEVCIEHNGDGPPTVAVTPVPCAEIIFESRLVDADNTVQATAARALEDIPEPSRCMLRVRLEGAPAMPRHEYVAALHTALNEHFFHVAIEDALDAASSAAQFSGQHTCLSKLHEVMAGRIADAPDKDTAAFEAYARDLAIKATRGHALPDHAAADVLS